MKSFHTLTSRLLDSSRKSLKRKCPWALASHLQQTIEKLLCTREIQPWIVKQSTTILQRSNLPEQMPAASSNQSQLQDSANLWIWRQSTKVRSKTQQSKLKKTYATIMIDRPRNPITNQVSLSITDWSKSTSRAKLLWKSCNKLPETKQRIISALLVYLRTRGMLPLKASDGHPSAKSKGPSSPKTCI